MKLIGMVEFVLEQYNKWEIDNNPDCQSSGRYILGTKLYASFLKTPLKLEMFIPCDNKGNIIRLDVCLENCSCGEEAVKDCKEDRRNLYLKGKEKILFKDFFYREEKGQKLIYTEGFEINIECLESMTINDLVNEDITLINTNFN